MRLRISFLAISQRNPLGMYALFCFVDNSSATATLHHPLGNWTLDFPKRAAIEKLITSNQNLTWLAATGETMAFEESFRKNFQRALRFEVLGLTCTG